MPEDGELLARGVRDLFAGAATRGYLDTASVGLPADATAQALHDAVARWQQRPDWLAWEADGERCRELFAALVGVAAQRVALIPAASVAAGVVAAALPAPARGANVVVHEQEHRSNLFAWLALEQRGWEVRRRPLERLLDAVDDDTALVAASVVQSQDGRVVDLSPLREHRALVYADATQAVGAVALDPDDYDVLACSGYKWLMCPRGIGFMVASERALAEVEPLLASWKAAVEPWGDPYGPPRELTPSARRFDVSLPWLLAPAACAALEVLGQIGLEAAQRHDLALAARLSRALGVPAPASPILAFPAGEEAAAALRARGVRCSLRAGRLRCSFHVYNDAADVELVAETLRDGDWKVC